MKNKTTKIGSQTTSGQTLKGFRPPVVVILGHIDHGKTTLLSKIKEKDLNKKESGGITQHISTYQVKLKSSAFVKTSADSQKSKVKSITFIDTPGHRAFNEMRSRGAKVADLAVLVVAADEGVKPQTIESLKYIKEAGIPYLVALNKIDLPDIKIEPVKKQLVENGISLEGYGGDVVLVPVSAKTGKGIDDLLEMILLLGEMVGIKGRPENKLEAVVIESKLDSRRGPLATVLVRDGTLKIGDEVKVEEVFGKIRAMFDEKGKNVSVVLPGQSVEVLGFKRLPPVGGRVTTEVTEKNREHRILAPSGIKKISETELEAGEDAEEKLKIILKADTAGSLEAIKASLPQNCQIIKAAVGRINESDILLASTSSAQIIGFNVKAPGGVKKLAEAEKVKISLYQVIYELLEEIEKKILKILEPTIDEEILGKAEILAEFEINKERVAGCRVNEGAIRKIDQIHLLREERILGDVRIKSLRKGKENVEQVKKGEEFGVIFSPTLDFKMGDMLVSYRKPQI